MCGNHNRKGLTAKSGDGLATAVAKAEWPTPTAQDGSNNAGPSQWKRNSQPLNVAVHQLEGQTAETTTGVLNAQFVEWLMGYPIDYTRTEPTESKD